MNLLDCSDLVLFISVFQVCHCDDLFITARMSAEPVTDIPASGQDLGVSREQILSAQFECYLKILQDPSRSEPGERQLVLWSVRFVRMKINDIFFRKCKNIHMFVMLSSAR